MKIQHVKREEWESYREEVGKLKQVRKKIGIHLRVKDRRVTT